MNTLSIHDLTEKHRTVIPAEGFVKNYHWGKVGNDSYISKFQIVNAKRSSSPINCEPLGNQTSPTIDDKPLAELWFGVHPSGPASVLVGRQKIRLDHLLAREPALVGSIDKFDRHNKTLPFLLKVLSIAKPLSLQVHPDKKLARVLHQKDPKNYPDSNHKPELAIALSDFEVLCDFRPHLDILSHLKTLPSLQKLVGRDNYKRYSQTVIENHSDEQQRNSLGACFKALMVSDRDIISRTFEGFKLEQHGKIDLALANLVLALENEYPGDPGVFAPFFLNYLKLTPGQAIYLRANKLHAYIRGDCVECMACSDNVVRAGLTTKYRDVGTLLSMLDFQPTKSSRDLLLAGITRNCDTVTFAPTEEFSVDQITLSQIGARSDSMTIPSVSSGSFVILVGNGVAFARNFYNQSIEHELKAGWAGYIPPKVVLNLYNIRGSLTIYRAYC